MDVNAGAVGAAFGAHGVKRIIHGHTHRPAEHRETGGERIVLADWRADRCEILLLDDAVMRRVALAL
jgi:UDP-2,3-diacylglucosamine hydrolase